MAYQGEGRRRGMITDREIIICKELIDIVDDILHDKLCDEKQGKWICEQHPDMVTVLDHIVDAHNEMLSVYCDMYSTENEELSHDIRSKIKKFTDELLMEGGAR